MFYYTVQLHNREASSSSQRNVIGQNSAAVETCSTLFFWAASPALFLRTPPVLMWAPRCKTNEESELFDGLRCQSIPDPTSQLPSDHNEAPKNWNKDRMLIW